MDMRALAALGTAYAAELNSFCICLLLLQTNIRGISPRAVFAFVCRIYIVLVTSPPIYPPRLLFPAYRI